MVIAPRVPIAEQIQPIRAGFVECERSAIRVVVVEENLAARGADQIDAQVFVDVRQHIVIQPLPHGPREREHVHIARQINRAGDIRAERQQRKSHRRFNDSEMVIAPRVAIAE